MIDIFIQIFMTIVRKKKADAISSNRTKFSFYHGNYTVESITVYTHTHTHTHTHTRVNKSLNEYVIFHLILFLFISAILSSNNYET